MLNAIFIPARDREQLRLIQAGPSDIATYQKIVDGPLHAYDLDRPAARLYYNDEGKQRQERPNQRATQILWAHNTDLRESDWIAGDVLLLGRPDIKGVDTTVPQEFIELLLTPGTFKTQVTTHAEPETWSGNALTFDDVFQAYSWVLNLSMRWLLVKDVRVIRAE